MTDSYFLCSKRTVSKLVEKATAEAKQILKEFNEFYDIKGNLKILIKPTPYVRGWGIGAKLLYDDEVVLEESDCSLLFLHLNNMMLDRMLKDPEFLKFRNSSNKESVWVNLIKF